MFLWDQQCLLGIVFCEHAVVSLQCKGPRSEWLLSQQDMQAYERADLRFRQELNR